MGFSHSAAIAQKARSPRQGQNRCRHRRLRPHGRTNTRARRSPADAIQRPASFISDCWPAKPRTSPWPRVCGSSWSYSTAWSGADSTGSILFSLQELPLQSCRNARPNAYPSRRKHNIHNERRRRAATRRRPDETCWEVPTMENGITESGWLSKASPLILHENTWQRQSTVV